MSPDTRIFFFVSVPDSDPYEASPFQGFAPSLCRHSGIFRWLIDMPSDIVEFSVDDLDSRLARRIAGEAPIWWMPLMPSAIEQVRINQHQPFGVLIVSPEEDAARYMKWKTVCPAPPLIVAESGGDLRYENLSLEALRQHCLDVCTLLGDAWGPETKSEIEAFLAHWTAPPARDLGYSIGGHNAFSPNVMALKVAGFQEIVTSRFTPKEPGIAPYVYEVVRTTNSVLEERKRIGLRDAHRINPLTPDLMLFSPSIYSHWRKGAPIKDPGNQEFANMMTSAVRAFNAQKGYSYELKVMGETGVEAKRQIEKVAKNPAFQLRAAELHLCTDAVGMLAASEISAVVRLPNEVNRTAGEVRQFASQKRGRDARDKKRAKAFHLMQNRLARAVPHDFIELIRRSESGIRILSDAPLEWLDIDGLPLGIRFNTSRLPTTPGNVLINQLISRPRIHLAPAAFNEILVVSALKRDDPIQPYFEIAMREFEENFQDKVKLRFVEVGSREELVQAFKEFEGVFAIFDGHGSHSPNEPAYLWLRDEKVDIWSLKPDLEIVPPIIMLSACDTHAADRNHATTATGFLSLGATTVLGSFFPLRADEAAIFAGRLLFRVAEYIPAAIQTFDRAITWSEVVGGMMRMTLLRDFLWKIHYELNLIDQDAFLRIHSQGNLWINDGAPEPFDLVKAELVEAGIPETQTSSLFKTAIATSSAISYVQLGRPETIVFDTLERVSAQMAVWKQEGDDP